MDEVQDVQVSREAMDGRSDRNRYADMEVGGRQCLEQVVEIASGTGDRVYTWAALVHPCTSRHSNIRVHRK